MSVNKDLVAASSTPLVLAILADADSYGYAILRRVRELFGGELEWTDGLLYPVLHRLERSGLVESRRERAESGRRRKYYRITEAGREQVADERRQWQTVDATLGRIWSALGENVVLLANLGWSAVLYVGFLWGRPPFARLIAWQTGYLYVFAAWAAVVVILFPPLFGWG